MTIIVEDGTGKPDAVSLASLVAADAYFSARGDSAWAALSEPEKEAALVKASASLSDAQRYAFKGRKAQGYAQRMPWPRSGAVERHGDAIPDNVVPFQVVDATCYLAGLVAQGEDLTPALKRGGQVQSKTVGPITTVYAAGAPGHTVYQAALGLLASLLRCESDVDGMLPQWGNDDPAQFDVGMHDNPGHRPGFNPAAPEGYDL